VKRRFKAAVDFALGAALPIRFSSHVYLGQKLAEFGVFDLPEQALQDLADDAVRMCHLNAKRRGRPWRVDITDWLDGQAASVAYFLLDDRDAVGRQLVEGELRAELAAILVKHGVRVPPVDTLEAH
jgi:uncharacterized protein (DUF58 family)